MTLVKEATALYKDEKLRIGLEEMIYAFDSSTIELCLKLCPWAEFHHGCLFENGRYKKSIILAPGYHERKASNTLFINPYGRSCRKGGRAECLGLRRGQQDAV